jgi:hypothetical protein
MSGSLAERPIVADLASSCASTVMWSAVCRAIAHLGKEPKIGVTSVHSFVPVIRQARPGITAIEEDYRVDPILLVSVEEEQHACLN